MRPLIGITSRELTVPTAKLPANGTFLPYVEAITSAGGAPVLVPLGAEPAAWIPSIVAALHGVLLTGGEDIAPHMYGAPPHPKLGVISELRDQVELELFKAAESRGLPILGICRGLQFINVARGGTLYQDIPSELPSAALHAQGSTTWNDRTHRALITSESTLHTIIGSTQCQINSLHHQAVKELGTGLRIGARCSADNTVEAIEGSVKLPWLLAVQWHPEVLWQSEPAGVPHRAIFRAFIAAAARVIGQQQH